MLYQFSNRFWQFLMDPIDLMRSITDLVSRMSLKTALFLQLETLKMQIPWTPVWTGPYDVLLFTYKTMYIFIKHFSCYIPTKNNSCKQRCNILTYLDYDTSWQHTQRQKVVEDLLAVSSVPMQDKPRTKKKKKKKM